MGFSCPSDSNSAAVGINLATSSVNQDSKAFRLCLFSFPKIQILSASISYVCFSFHNQYLKILIAATKKNIFI